MSPLSLEPFKFSPKPASGSDLFYFDWSDWIRSNQNEQLSAVDGQVSVTATPDGLTITDIEAAGFVVRCRIAGGTPNLTYTVVCKVLTIPNAREDSAAATLYITR